MAFLDFAQPAAGPQMPVGRTVQFVATNLDPQEWQIVDLARTDGRGSLHAPGRLARLHRLLVGPRPDPRLADPRLEALRRLAVEAWHKGYAVPLSALRDFRGAGFTTAQLETLLARISAARTARAPRSYA